MGTAIYCQCLFNGNPKVIGSINPLGELLILRAHHFFTIIKSGAFEISCKQCSYSKEVFIESMAVNRPTYESIN